MHPVAGDGEGVVAMDARDKLLIALAQHALGSSTWAHAPIWPLKEALDDFRAALSATTPTAEGET